MEGQEDAYEIGWLRSITMAWAMAEVDALVGLARPVVLLGAGSA